MKKDIFMKIIIMLILITTVIILSIIGIKKSGWGYFGIELIFIGNAFKLLPDILGKENIMHKLFFSCISIILFSSVFVNYKENATYIVIPFIALIIGLIYGKKLKPKSV